MIIRNRRKREGLLGRLTRPFSRIKPPAGYGNVATSARFQLEIDKEIERANRRDDKPEFAIVSLDFCDHKVTDELLDTLIHSFQSRLRVSDTIGWHQMKLATLLPETNREGAMQVCDSLVKIAEENSIELKVDVSIYPWDDRLLGTYTTPNSNDKGLNGRNDDWKSSPSDDFGSSANRNLGGPKFSSYNPSASRGGVATMVRPKKLTQPKPSLTGGTGVHVLFCETEKTPIWKRAVDVLGAGAGLVVLSPFLLAAAASIRLTSSGPVFFRQEREGKDGKVFHILKFRTMCVDAEQKKDGLRKHSEQDGPAFKLTNDPRVTGLGKYLRKSCIDELPQLFNVLTGDMSLVGPRPLPVSESQQCLPWQRQRLTVLPGLTCTWQARGGRDVKFAEWMRMDLDYIQQRGFWYDMRLIGETAMVVVMHKGSV